MNPDQNQYSIDYLNEIASPQKKPAMSNKLFLFVIGGVVLVAIIVGIMLLSSSASGPTQKMQTLAARLTTLGSIANKSQKTIKTGSLRATNSNLTIFLTNTNRDIVAPLKTNGVDTTKIDESIKKAENGDKLTKKLEDARLNAVFDRTYAREIDYQLATVAALMKQVYTETGSKSLKEFLEKTDASLQPISKQFAEFNSANE